MYLNQLFSPSNSHLANYKAVDETNTQLSEDEKRVILGKALQDKIGKINSENYLKALNYQPDYKIPSADDLHKHLLKELSDNFQWKIDKYNEQPIEQIAYYFANDPRFKSMGDGFDNAKGLLLYGPIGCGKTTLLKLLGHNPYNPFWVVSARKIADEFAIHGHTIIARYSMLQPVNKREWYNHSTIGLCIDDMGTEPNKKNYGNEVNVLADIILNRYDNAEGKGKTHITTNMSADNIKADYGARAVSRMREMFNMIEFPFDGPDRRK